MDSINHELSYHTEFLKKWRLLRNGLNSRHRFLNLNRYQNRQMSANVMAEWHGCWLLQTTSGIGIGMLGANLNAFPKVLVSEKIWYGKKVMISWVYFCKNYHGKCRLSSCEYPKLVKIQFSHVFLAQSRGGHWFQLFTIETRQSTRAVEKFRTIY